MSAIPADLVTPKVIARDLQCHITSVYRAIHAGRLPAYRRGGRYLISRAAALALLEPVRVEPREPADARADERRHAAAMELLRAQGYRV